jgi:ribokinase
MNKKQIVVIGSSNTDMMITVDHFPKPGETVLGKNYFSGGGGKGANQAISAARAGGSVVFIARLGKDHWGDQALEGFVKDRISVQHITRDVSTPSGVALIFVSSKGQNCIAVAGGANNQLSISDIENALATITKAGLLMIQLEIPMPTVMAAIALANQKNIPVILNPAPAQLLPKGMLKQVSILVLNETEAEILTKLKVTNITTAAKASQLLLRQGVHTVILTLGKKGAWVATNKIRQHVPGFKVTALDSTAAGDTFIGALAVALTENKELLDAVLFGNAAAALAVGKNGAQISIPSRHNIDIFLKSRIPLQAIGINSKKSSA